MNTIRKMRYSGKVKRPKSVTPASCLGMDRLLPMAPQIMMITSWMIRAIAEGEQDLILVFGILHPPEEGHLDHVPRTLP